MAILKKILKFLIIFLIIFGTLYYFLQKKDAPAEIQYGVSFNTAYAGELGLEWKDVYLAALDDLNIKHFRLAAHWDLTEQKRDQYNFEELTFQVEEAAKRDADVIFGVGRRLPRWPECHVPGWAEELSWEEQKEELREYIKKTVNKFKKYDNIKYWQVENEPFLTVFAYEHCGDLDVDFLEEEIALVKELDPTREILVTDSGNLGLWGPAYKRGDVFGTSVYVYLWNPDIGPFKSFLPPSYYRVKENIMEMIYGDKETFLIELSIEPWLTEPIVKTPRKIQLERMDINKFNEIIEFAKNTRLEKQYLWGVEWWYYMNERNHPEFWDRAKEIYNN
jgi:hypothetical protein